jgi:DNA sulfur modification protein DndD
MPETEVVHRVSSEKRGVLLNWIDEALNTAPQQLAVALHKRENLKQQLATIDQGLARVPISQILQPLRQNRLQLEREFGRLEGEQERLGAEDKRLTYHLERIAGSKRRVTDQIISINTDEERIKLAAQTKKLLDEYQQQLTRRKLNQLATQLVKRFNQLSRKRNFIDKVSIDPDSFHITLYQAGKPFPRTQLSAGEDQIFAIATLWALREVSGRPLPVVIDTPLSRLDDEHRRTMLAEFMPQVAQQVIILATTTEIDEQAFTFLKPIVSKAYLLSEKADGATTEATEQSVGQQAPLIGLEELVTNATQ